ncbi:MAG: SMP-30/gluconolactonase/LRE family protein [Acidimicrobiales bacterium]|nr:SMP-30/gluconolactonase/LRE family protein [Acidimicrobiales bacterium]
MHEPVVLIGGLDFGEGPRWHDSRLWYSDFMQHCVYAVNAEGHRETMVDLGDEQPSGLGWLPGGDLLVVAMTAKQVWRVHEKVITVHADLSDIATWHCNDMVVASDGTAYVGNFGYDIENDVEHPVASTLAIVHPDGSVSSGPSELAFPNGSVITPDDRTLVVAETFGSRLSAFDIEEGGLLSNRRVWADTAGVLPDGCCLDAAGGIWVADAFGSGVVRYLEGGEVTDRLPTPLTSFACMLGGSDGRTLYCITAPAAGEQRAGSGDGAIVTFRVEHAGAGRP